MAARLGSADDALHSNAPASTPKGRFRSSSSARPAATSMPRARAFSSPFSSRRVLPIPASPSIRATASRPEAARSRTSLRTWTSASRPWMRGPGASVPMTRMLLRPQNEHTSHRARSPPAKQTARRAITSYRYGVVTSGAAGDAHLRGPRHPAYRGLAWPGQRLGPAGDDADLYGAIISAPRPRDIGQPADVSPALATHARAPRPGGAAPATLPWRNAAAARARPHRRLPRQTGLPRPQPP